MVRIITLLFLLTAGCVAGLLSETKQTSAASPSIYDFKMKDIDGKDVKLKKYKGSVLLVVNTASKCGYTPQYESLQATYDKFASKGFYVLGFPTNNFGEQEPGTDAEIKEFCTSKYKVTFPMFAKVTVKGDNRDGLFAYLTDLKINPVYGGDITWNFHKFLIDRNGKILGRLTSKEKPDGPAITAAIEEALAAKASSY